MIRKYLIIIIIAVSYLVGVSVFSAWGQDGTAVILIGDVDFDISGIYNNIVAEKVANEAKADFEAAGYKVVIYHIATKQDLIAAIKDPETTALLMIGHGDTSPFPQVRMVDGWVKANDFLGQTFPNIQEVTIHSCAQDLKSWRNLFPNAEFHSWSTRTFFPAIYWWQLFHTYKEYHPMPIVNADLWSKNVITIEDITITPFSTPFDPWFEMDDATASIFGNQTINLIGTDDQGLNGVPLLGLEIHDGHIINYSYDEILDANFNLVVPESVFFDTIEFPNAILNAYNNGLIDVFINQYTGVSEEVLFNGSAAVLFGINASVRQIPEPSTLLLLSSGLTGLVVFGRKSLFKKA